MKEQKKLDDKIKSSFESLNRKAPDMLWNQLADSLPTDSAATAASQPENDRLYSKIRDSFSVFRQKAPQQVWERINRQLNIDLVWSRLNRELDKSPSANWHVARWAAVLLLFMLSFAGGYFLYNEQAQAEFLGAAGNISDLSFLATEKGMAVEVDQAERSSIAEQAGKPVVQEAQVTEESSTADGQQKNLIISFKPSPNDEQQGEVASSDFSLPIKDDIRGSEDAFRAGNDRTSASAGLTSGRNSRTAGREATSSAMEEKEGLGDSSTFSQNLASADRNAALSIPFRIARLPMNNSMVKESSFSIQAIALDSGALKMIPEAYEEKGIRTYRLSFGPVLAYNNSWLLNNETRNSFDKGSLISASPTFKQNLGIALHYSFNEKSALASEFHFISKAGQEYSTFSDGYFLKKGLELSYYKLYLQYQRNLLPQRESILSDLTVKAGLYGGLLHRKSGEIRNTESTYSSFDYGVRFSFGQEKRVSRVIIGYGITGERGLTNIFLGSDKMPGRFNKTYTLNFGPYLNFRYHLR